MTPPLVLCYHAVSEVWPAPLSVTPDRFEAQMASLARKGYRGVTFSEAVRHRTAARTVAVTFDDGFRSVVTHGAPVLETLGWPATIFVPTDFVGTGRPMSWPGISDWLHGPFADELTPCSWEELQWLRGLDWEVGSHSCSHPRLSRLSDAALDRELSRSREVCEARLSAPCRSVAYPYGDVDARVVAAARGAGYMAGGALPRGTHGRTPLAYGRIGIYHDDDARRFRLKVHALTRVLQRRQIYNLIRDRPRRWLDRHRGGRTR